MKEDDYLTLRGTVGVDMNCQRCLSPMSRLHYFDAEISEEGSVVYHCLLCGNMVDETILKNRTSPPVYKSDLVVRPPGLPIQIKRMSSIVREEENKERHDGK
jgi:hypothetical protein